MMIQNGCITTAQGWLIGAMLACVFMSVSCATVSSEDFLQSGTYDDNDKGGDLLMGVLPIPDNPVH